MTRDKGDRIKYDSVLWNVGPGGKVATRQVKPGGYVSPKATMTASHTEPGKANAGWRIQWLLLGGLLLLIGFAVGPSLWTLWLMIGG